MQIIVPKVALHCCSFKIICSSQADLALYEFSSFYHSSLERKTSFESFQKGRDRSDDFGIKETNICNCKIISSVFKLILVLSHGQAGAERGASVNNKVLNVNMHKISSISCKLIIDHMNCHSFFATIIPNHKESVEISEMFSTKVP